jgi:hypothetical protein
MYKKKFKTETIGHIQGHCDPLMVFKLFSVPVIMEFTSSATRCKSQPSPCMAVVVAPAVAPRRHLLSWLHPPSVRPGPGRHQELSSSAAPREVKSSQQNQRNQNTFDSQYLARVSDHGRHRSAGRHRQHPKAQQEVEQRLFCPSADVGCPSADVGQRLLCPAADVSWADFEPYPCDDRPLASQTTQRTPLKVNSKIRGTILNKGIT